MLFTFSSKLIVCVYVFADCGCNKKVFAKTSKRLVVALTVVAAAVTLSRSSRYHYLSVSSSGAIIAGLNVEVYSSSHIKQLFARVKTEREGNGG